MNPTCFTQGKASVAQIAAHLHACDAVFEPPLSDRVDIAAYADKIAAKAGRFEAWAGDELAGLLAAYCNAPDRGTAFVTSVSVLPAWQDRGMASCLLENCIAHVRELGFSRIELEVGGNNEAAITLYEKHGFSAIGKQGDMVKMALDLKRTHK